MVEAEQVLSDNATAVSPEESPPREPRTLIEIISSQLETLRAYHRAVLETEAVEAVHKMRVTTRRLQASLDLLERELNSRPLKRRLRKWRRALSRVRNYDVFMELIEKEAAGRRPARRAQLQLVKTIVQERRIGQAAKIRPLLEGISVDVIAAGLGMNSPTSGADPLEAGGGSSERQAGVPDQPLLDERRVAGYAAERLDQRLAEFQAMVAQSHPTTDPSELHQLRIAAKRVRYLLEVVSEMGYGDAARALVWLRTLQDRIGDWHDLEGLEEEVIAVVSSRQFMKHHLVESSRMLEAAAHLQKKKQSLVAKLFPVRVPRHLPLTGRRIARALRKNATQAGSPAGSRRPARAEIQKPSATRRVT